MTKLIPSYVLLFAGLVGGLIAMPPANATAVTVAMQYTGAEPAGDPRTSRRIVHHTRHVGRRNHHDAPTATKFYLDRPLAYAPAPVVPFNYGYGFGDGLGGVW